MSLSDSAERLARRQQRLREADEEILRWHRAGMRADRAQWWIDHGATVAVVVVSFLGAATLVALQVWLP